MPDGTRPRRALFFFFLFLLFFFATTASGLVAPGRPFAVLFAHQPADDFGDKQKGEKKGGKEKERGGYERG